MAGIFKAYDIRGVYGDVLNKDMGYKIGMAFGQFIGQGKKIVCGRDERVHSPELQEAFINGVRATGCHVVNMGLCTTPMTYYSCFTDEYDGSAMITASHNPGQYNGLKFCRENAIPVGYEDGIDRMEADIEQDLLREAEMQGELGEKDYREGYLAFLSRKCYFRKKFSFAVDAGNGMGGYIIEDFLKRTKQKASELYWDLDFTFPNHEANPLNAKNMVDLQKAVRDEELDFGVAFDGDADRCFFVDDQGEIIPADILTALIAVDVLKRQGSGAIVYDIRSSRVVAELIEEHGGTPILCRVGHSFMKAMLRKHEGPFGGELAGHFYFQEFSYADSAFLTMITVMNIIDAAGKPLSKLLAPYRKYFPSGEINFRTEKADMLIETAPRRFPNGTVNTIDGIRIDFEDWWFCLRKSNTEPLLRLVLEGNTAEILEEKVKELKSWILGEGAEIEH